MIQPSLFPDDHFPADEFLYDNEQFQDEMFAYTAGLFDGEGCINITKVNPKEGRANVNPCYSLSVSLASTNQSVVEWLKEMFGGSITDRSQHKYYRKNPGWMPAWNWAAGSNLAQTFLTFILPYLKIKQFQAELALKFQDYKHEHPIYTRDYQYIQEVLEQEETYYQHLNSLHAARKQWTQSESFIKEIEARSLIPVTADPLTPAALAYLAGLIDGEGCIRISRSMPTEKRGKGHLRQPSYRLYMKIANTDRAIIDWLLATFQGSIHETSSAESRAKTGWSQAWEWGMGSQKACAILKQVAPYMIIKRDRAMLAIEFQTYANQYARYVQGNRPQEVIDHLEAYRQQINGLNGHKSISDASE
jgi:hypothetical protein